MWSLARRWRDGIAAPVKENWGEYLQEKLHGYVGVMAHLRSTKSGVAWTGWVSEASETRLSLRFEEPQEFEQGETFVAELQGKDTTVTFAAAHLDSTTTEFYNILKSGALKGATSVDLDFFDVEHNFRVASEFRFRPSEGDYRVAVWDVTAELEYVGPALELTVINIGDRTMGCYAPCKLEQGSKHTLRIASAYGEVKLEGTVLECRALDESANQFRTLFAVEPSGRLNAGRWRRFIDQQSMAA